MFKIIGVLVLAYDLWAVSTGEVWAKSGPSARLVTRLESPRYFWIVTGIYAALGMALLFVF